MDVGVVGYILIPVGIFLVACKDRKYLLYLTVFFAPFTGTAVVNIGEALGVQPAYYFGGLYITRFAVDRALGSRSLSVYRPILLRVAPLWLFAFVAVLSIMAIPLYGPIEINDPSGDVTLLSLGFGNITQFMYLAFAVLLVTCVSFEKMGVDSVGVVVKTILGSGVFVATWGCTQVFMFIYGITYPDHLFNNSVSFGQHFANEFSSFGILRFSSVAPEPSMFARFMLIPIFISYYSVYYRGFLMGRRRAIGLALFLTVTALVSGSSTAFAGLIGGGGFLVWMLLKEQERSILTLMGLSQRLKVFAMLAGLVVLLAGTALAAAQWLLGLQLQDILSLVELLVIDKVGTDSGQTRLGGALHGLELFWDHPLLGVGWGSNRTFDVVTNVLANTGVLGALLFLGWHLAVARKAAWKGLQLLKSGCERAGLYLRSLLLAFLAMFFAKALSEPDIVYLDHWILVGVLIAASSRLVQEKDKVDMVANAMDEQRRSAL